MAQKNEQQAPATSVEGLKVLTPSEVPEWVDCFVSKRQIRGADARRVELQPGKEVWVHKRFLGEVGGPAEEEEFEEEYGYDYDEEPTASEETDR